MVKKPNRNAFKVVDPLPESEERNASLVFQLMYAAVNSKSEHGIR